MLLSFQTEINISTILQHFRANKLRQKLVKTAAAVESSAANDAEKLAKKAMTEVEELQHFISGSWFFPA